VDGVELWCDSWKREIIQLRGHDVAIVNGELPGQTEEERSRPTILSPSFVAWSVEMEFGQRGFNFFETILVI
jgi:hypothetical protein